jgi:hypothetical protein
MAEAAAPEAAAQAQQPAAARPKYNPKPVALGWKDVVRYLEELWHEATVAKIDAPLDVLALGTSRFYFFPDRPQCILYIFATSRCIDKDRRACDRKSCHHRRHSAQSHSICTPIIQNDILSHFNQPACRPLRALVLWSVF